ncbi:hypothetical protein DDE20_14145 [Pararhodobacter oceanensis]|uniref:Zinc finger CHC2-type domain-containing protein n=2 Tax=Pararhodobacter oceanensis TaxID=2172121 RepID=A0A2T8HS18_9RHOB|nr:hypothetical protein DDE20_14145 [Pararhodobacter oceanensis]
MSRRRRQRPFRPKPNYNASTSDIFREVNEAARGQIRELAERWLSKTRRSGDNLLALNPTRNDKNIGSFSINTRSGVWADFATGDSGADIVSFYAYLHDTTQIEAARELAKLVGVRV